MRLLHRTSHLLMLFMALFLLCEPMVSTSRGSDDADATPIETFGSRTEALENVLGSDAPWEFPYAAPRPAGLNDQEMTTTLALRRLVLDGNQQELSTLTEQVERRQDELPVQMRFWLAFAQSELNLNQACLANLREIMRAEIGWHDLETGQQIWILTATADLHFLLGYRTEAAACYDRLAVSPVTQLNLWGQYQLAGMDFLERNFAAAALRYRRVCDAEKSGTWREHACGMADLAARLEQLGRGGNEHGDLASAHE